jgi:hypothetical protein
MSFVLFAARYWKTAIPMIFAAAFGVLLGDSYATNFRLPTMIETATSARAAELLASAALHENALRNTVRQIEDVRASAASDADTRVAAAEETFEQELADYVEAQNKITRGCAIVRADLDWLRRVERGFTPPGP